MAQALYADQKNSIDDICKTLRVSRSTLYRYVQQARREAPKPSGESSTPSADQ